MRITANTIFNHGNYYIIAESFETSSSWGHKAYLKHNQHPLDTLATAKINYYNRTWERYRYQSVLLDVISNAINERAEQLFYMYKITNGKTRLSKQEKENLTNNNDTIKELKELYKYFADEHRG